MIELIGLEKTFPGHGGLLGQQPVRALRGVNLKIESGSTLSIIGESGCGKTTLGRILAGYESYTGGDIRFGSTSVHQMSKRERREHFRKIQLIQQDPYAALNPARALGYSLFDPLSVQAKRLGKNRNWVYERAQYLLSLVGLDPLTTLKKYQHNLSGGQRQRLVIARSLTVDPEVLIADEAVSMIDVSLRLEILSLLSDLRERLGITVIFITHDVAAARYIADDGDMVVIYKGEIVEQGRTDEVIQRPLHPYTQSLLSAMPVLRGLEYPGPDRFLPKEVLQETLADDRCSFALRCPFATEQCNTMHPELVHSGVGTSVNACFYPVARRVTPIPSELLTGDAG